MQPKPGYLAALILAYGSGAFAADATQIIPTTYEAGHFYATPETTEGQKLKLLVDTGGAGGSGMYVLTPKTLARLHLTMQTCKLGDSSVQVVTVPDFKPGFALPRPEHSACGYMALVNAAVDDTLGAGYLPDHIWTFDYPRQRLILESSAWKWSASTHPAMMSFPTNPYAQRLSGLPRIVIKVDGQDVDMLLDTGATAHPSTVGKRASGTPTVNGLGVTSYIVSSIFNRWHKAHPDWSVVENGDDLFGPKNATRMIKVPRVEIARWAIGPVWFTERADTNFDALSSLMDKQVEGSVGANVFQHFVMTLDYPRSIAFFLCAQDCTAVGKPTVATPPPAP